ncbi:hypothetical protein J3A83DRAFT_4093971 [Scleroderma citrinum]
MQSNTSPSSSTQLDPPYAVLLPDDPAAVDPARRRVATKSRCFHLLSSLRLKLKTRKPPIKKPLDKGPCNSTDDSQTLPQLTDETQSIVIQADSLPALPGDQNVTIYRWAVLYENQRGITVFSTPCYSSLTLLPTDPFPFTVPSATSRRSQQPNVSLNHYPLPDGTWRWVSRAWMIDMRTDLGEVQHDGFEYNWSFRKKHWHAEIGPLSMGAWVRRRRWVRLMMRPAKWISVHQGPSLTEDYSSILPSTSAPFLVHPGSNVALDEASQLWVGDPDKDWHRCRRLLGRAGADGHKLELWQMWLGPHILDEVADIEGKDKHQGKEYQPSAPTFSKHSEHAENSPPLPYLRSMLQKHADAIIRTFIFPDSRAQFLELITRAGLRVELTGSWFSPAAVVSFWSYTGDLDKSLDNEALGNTESLDNQDKSDNA